MNLAKLRKRVRTWIAAALLFDSIPVGVVYGFHQAFVMIVLAWIVWRISDVPLASDGETKG